VLGTQVQRGGRRRALCTAARPLHGCCRIHAEFTSASPLILDTHSLGLSICDEVFTTESLYTVLSSLELHQTIWKIS
jgi:hypothetical protein